MERTEILKEMELERKAIERSARRLGELQTQLDTCEADDWDWIDVRTASIILGVTPQAVYKRLNEGKLKTRHVGAKTFVSKAEIMAIDDSYSKVG